MKQRWGRVKNVVEITTFSRSSIWSKDKDEEDTFPKSFEFSKGMTGWDLNELDMWMIKQKEKSRKQVDLNYQLCKHCGQTLPHHKEEKEDEKQIKK